MRALSKVIGAVVCAAGGLAVAGVAAVHGADDYTLPFYDPTVTLSYGVDRDSQAGRQLDWTGQVWLDDDLHPGRVYDQHTGIDYPMPLYSDVAAAREGTVVDFEGGFGTRQWGNFGNFVLVEHEGGRRTLYYHLASGAEGGIAVGLLEELPAGEPIGLSGCSGICYGPHLHFELDRPDGDDEWVPTDPMFERRWTTWPGRVPFLAAYVRESNSGVEVIRRGMTVTHWVEFRNTGGRTWRNTGAQGRIALATWNPAAHSSLFKAADWPYAWLATLVDQPSVPPDQVGRFTFGLRGGPPPGSYTETFDLLATAVRWFDHARIGSFYVPITISNQLE